MKKIIFFSFIFFSLTSFCQKINKFSLEGKTKDIPDGTVLRLQSDLTNQYIDSAVVKNNNFIFRTALPSFPYRAHLVKDGSSIKTIWLENNPMTFNSVNTSFTSALITGSKNDSLATILRSKYRSLNNYDAIVAYEMQFIEDHPNDLISVANLSIMAMVFGKKKSIELFSKMSKENKESEYGKKIESILPDLTDEKEPRIGDKYVDFTMKNQNEIEKKLSDFSGEIILLEFWASWCGPCRQENPNLINTYNKFKSDGFEIFAVSLDDKKEEWIKAIRKDGLNWEHVSDLKGRYNKAALLYKVNGIPDNILIDRNGIIIGRNLRGDALNQKLIDLLSKGNVAITTEQNATKIKISGNTIWKDENGKEISKIEFKKLLDTQKYVPNLDTENNIMSLQKI